MIFSRSRLTVGFGKSRKLKSVIVAETSRSRCRGYTSLRTCGHLARHCRCKLAWNIKNISLTIYYTQQRPHSGIIHLTPGALQWPPEDTRLRLPLCISHIRGSHLVSSGNVSHVVDAAVGNMRVT